MESGSAGNHCSYQTSWVIFLAMSAQVNHDVVVDTSLDASVYITRVFTTMEDAAYGVGHEILITVVFSAPVSLSYDV